MSNVTLNIASTGSIQTPNAEDAVDAEVRREKTLFLFGPPAYPAHHCVLSVHRVKWLSFLLR